MFGFLGGNGAGKTTSLRMALDLLLPTSGRIEVLGKPPSRENAAEIGFLPEERGLYRLMTVLDTVVYFGRLKGMEPGKARQSANALIDRLGLRRLGRLAGRQAIQGHGAEGPTRHRPGQFTEATAARRTLLGPGPRSTRACWRT